MPAHGYKLGLGVDFGMPDVPLEERIKIIADAGFDAVFTGWSKPGSLQTPACLIKDAGLIYQSVHAPFNKVNLLWQEGPDGDAVQSMLADCLRECAAVGVKIVVFHVWIGFNEEHPTQIGLRRYGELLSLAEELGVKIAFENTEGELYLQWVFDRLFSSPAAGFCIDTGHEMCYNERGDLIRRYGSSGKLLCTHINDNFGRTGEKITWLDDSHVLPFDGTADWRDVAKRLANVDYTDILTAELTVKSKPERNTHDIYSHLDCRGFVSLAYERLAKFAAILREENDRK